MPVYDEQHRQDRTLSDKQPTQAGAADNWASDASASEGRLVGTVFAGKYQVLSELGEGGMSIVYLARHLGLDKLMALKVLHTHLATRGNSQLRFQQEARGASQLNHPSIITMHDFGITDDGTPYLVMDYVEGESLAHFLTRQRRLTFEEALPIFQQTCSALAHAHEHGLIHRDLKPSNIMLKRLTDGSIHVLVVDFGVAKLVAEPSETPGRLTQTGEFVGSPFYMSPEQCQGKQLDSRADIYSMGCVMYETLTGRVPFEGESIYSILYKHMNDMPPPASTLRPSLKKIPSLEKILLKSLAKTPGARYQTMLELGAALSGIKSGRRTGPVKFIRDQFELLKLKGQLKPIAITAAVVASLVLFTAAAIGNPRPVLQAFNICPPDFTETSTVWPVYPPPVEPQSIEDVLFKQEEGKARSAVKMAEQINNASTVKDPQTMAQRYSSAGAFYFKYGRYEEALPWFTKGVNTLVSCASDHACIEESQRETALRREFTYLGECQYRLRNYKAAEQCFSERLKIERKIYAVRNWLYEHEPALKAALFQADCLYRLGDVRAAYHIFSAPGFDHDTESLRPQITTISSSEYADIAMQMRRYKDAEELYKRAARLWSSVPNGAKYVVITQGGLAECIAAQGQYDRAKVVYESAWRAVNLLPPSQAADPEIATVLQNYSNLLLKHSNLVINSPDFFRAIQIYDKAKYLRHA